MPVMVIVVGRRGKRGRGGERGERGDNLSLTHPLSFQITEMYSSGGDLHLELLSGQLQGSKSLWVRKYCLCCNNICDPLWEKVPLGAKIQNSEQVTYVIGPVVFVFVSVLSIYIAGVSVRK